jgi:hypothetical protein
MGAHEFGRLIDRAMIDGHMSQARLAVLVGELPDGRVLNETQVRRIREGGRRLDGVLVARLIKVLDLDEAEAWATAGLWPPDLDLATYRELRKVSPLKPALAHAAGGDESPPAPSLRNTDSPKGRRRGNSCYSYRTGHPRRLRKRLLGPAHIGQRVAA